MLLIMVLRQGVNHDRRVSPRAFNLHTFCVQHPTSTEKRGVLPGTACGIGTNMDVIDGSVNIIQ